MDPQVQPDILMDATKLILWSDQLHDYSAVYCSHNLEHYYHFDVVRVLQGMLAVLAPGGHVYLKVPDLQAVAEHLAKGGSLHDNVPGSSFDWHQCLYGDVMGVLRAGEGWAHKTGFTEESLKNLLLSVGFVNPIFEHGVFELAAMAYKPNVQPPQLDAV